MIGQGRLRGITTDLPRAAARRFSDRLERQTGCRLAWHRLRECYVVYRQVGGKFGPFRGYTDIEPGAAFTSDELRATVNLIRWSDAQMSNDFGRMLQEYKRITAETRTRDRAAYVDERYPDFVSDLRRFHRIVCDGRRRQRIFDMAGWN